MTPAERLVYEFEQAVINSCHRLATVANYHVVREKRRVLIEALQKAQPALAASTDEDRNWNAAEQGPAQTVDPIVGNIVTTDDATGHG